MNWLLHPIESLKNWGVKKFVLGVVNSAIKKYDGNITKACYYIELYIAKIEALLSFFKSLRAKIADRNLDGDEAVALVDEAKKLGEELVAK